MRLYERTSIEQTYAGMTDLVCHMDGDIWLLDWKTGKTPNSAYPEWRMQTAAYRNADGRPNKNGVVSLDKETGLPKLFDCSDTYEKDIRSFRHLVAYWHSEHPDENGLPSATTVLGVLDKPALMYWAVNCACDYILEHYEVGGDNYTVIDKARKEWRKVSKKAMNIGSAVHAAIEHYLKTGEEPKDVEAQVEAGFLAFLEFRDNHELQPIDIELVVYGS